MQFIGMCCVKNIDTKITGLTGIEWGCSDLIKFTDSDIIPVLDYEDNCEFVRFKWICPKCGQSLAGEPINCEDWVVEKVFSIKGDTPTSKPLS